jgi:hypothetical protein
MSNKKKPYKLSTFYASSETVNKYFSKDIIISEKNKNDLYTKLDVILLSSPLAIHNLENENNEYVVYAKKNDLYIWSTFKSKLQSSYFNN